MQGQVTLAVAALSARARPGYSCSGCLVCPCKARLLLQWLPCLPMQGQVTLAVAALSARARPGYSCSGCLVCPCKARLLLQWLPCLPMQGQVTLAVAALSARARAGYSCSGCLVCPCKARLLLQWLPCLPMQGQVTLAVAALSVRARPGNSCSGCIVCPCNLTNKSCFRESGLLADAAGGTGRTGAADQHTLPPAGGAAGGERVASSGQGAVVTREAGRDGRRGYWETRRREECWGRVFGENPGKIPTERPKPAALVPGKGRGNRL